MCVALFLHWILYFICVLTLWILIVAVVSIISWQGQIWTSIVICTLRTNLFVFTWWWQLTDPSPTYASDIIEFALTGRALAGQTSAWEVKKRRRGCVQISLRCTASNTHVHKHAINFSLEVILPENVSFQEYFVTLETCTVAWPRGSMGNGGLVSVHLFIRWASHMCHMRVLWEVFALLSDI